jgi:uncharacterized membrane protein
MAEPDTRTKHGERIALIDLLRGIAILAMAAYHLCWDLTYYGLIDVGLGETGPWVVVQRAILSSFLLLVGVGLVLGHGEGLRWRAFRRRLAMLVGAALLVSLGTYWLFGEYFSYFGVLHAIALSSLLALPFLRAPLRVTVATAVAVIVLGCTVSSALFDTRWLSWIGFFVASPPTTDLVPLFPWFGVVLCGVVAARLAAPLRVRLAAWRPRHRLARGLALAGRWSLVIYLVHQPLLLGVVYPLALWHAPPPGPEVAFTQSCSATCGASGQEAKYCTLYCGCALDLATRDNLWAAIAAAPRSLAEEQSVAQMNVLCTAMAK